MSTQHILMIVTGHTLLGHTGKTTGVWLEELSTPYYAFIDAGLQVDIATPSGMPVPIDPGSLKIRGKNPMSVERWLDDPQAQQWSQRPLSLEALNADPYQALFLPGGHGTMWDLPDNKALSSLLSQAWERGTVIASVCHGAVGLVRARDTTGRALVAGRRITAFTNHEEDAAGLSTIVPFLLETRLRELGAQFESAHNFQPHAVTDGRLITGQNPASSMLVAERVLSALTVTDKKHAI